MLRLRRRGGASAEHPTLQRIVADLTEGHRWGSRAYKESPTARELTDPREQIEVLLSAFEGLRRGRRLGWSDEAYAYDNVVKALLRRSLPWDERTLALLLDALVRSTGRIGRGLEVDYGDPVKSVLGAVERTLGDRPPPPDIASRLRKVRRSLDPAGASNRVVIARIDRLLGEKDEQAPLHGLEDPWAKALLAGHPGEDADAVLRLARTATSSKPTKAFRAAAEQLAGQHGAEGIGSLAGSLLAAAAAVRDDDGGGGVPPETGDVLRGLAWIAGTAGGAEAVRGLGAMAVAGWRKVPYVGPMSQKAANAALNALADLPEGAPELGRVRAQLKQANAVAAAEAAIDRAADALGIPRQEFEERVVPDLGFGPGGTREIAVGDHTAELRVTDRLACELRFVTPKGRRVKTVPAAVKEGHPAELAELRRLAKDVKTTAGAQRLRLERLLVDDRSWPYETWRERYADHGLVGALARRLIWTVDDVPVLAVDGELTDAGGAPVPDPGPGANVRLWHPVLAAPEEVRTWRVALEEREVRQPFKQAHREVYLLTAAERETGTYSNRFAAHVLRQHQMAALARERGWRYSLQGAWDSPDEQADLDLPAHDLHAEFFVERPWDTEELNEMGVFTYVLSDQVRFTRRETGAPVGLEDVPPRVFSEAMRDVDLFVGVTSIGNDPQWNDRGPARRDDRLDAYWQSYAFGELGEQAEVRRDLLERLLPKLALRDVARLHGRFLRVEGKLRTYKIHLGSGNILMEPNDEYLCIVPGRGRDESDQVFLPFEGDRGLAVVLSKAFLLARDDKIDDRTITSQIRRR